jgi:hypothetical protein
VNWASGKLQLLFPALELIKIDDNIVSMTFRIGLRARISFSQRIGKRLSKHLLLFQALCESSRVGTLQDILHHRDLIRLIIHANPSSPLQLFVAPMDVLLHITSLG